MWRERELLDRRERAILDRERELLARAAHDRRWLRERREREPTARAWCAEQERRLERREVTPEELAELQRRRQQAGERRAGELRARHEVRAPLSRRPSGRWQRLGRRQDRHAALDRVGARGQPSLPPMLVLFASLAVTLARMAPAALSVTDHQEEEGLSCRIGPAMRG